MSTGWTPSGEIVQQRINHEWTHIGANVFGRCGGPWSAPGLVGAAGRIRRHELDAAFLSTNEPGYAR
jgi:hypothetical protein